jgi:hypothetical protein
MQHRSGFNLVDAFAKQIPQAGSDGVEMMDGGIVGSGQERLTIDHLQFDGWIAPPSLVDRQ